MTLPRRRYQELEGGRNGPPTLLMRGVCSRGHPITEENVGGGPGHYWCRRCKNDTTIRQRQERASPGGMCMGCERRFMTDRAFEKHQVGGRCLTDREMKERGFRHPNGRSTWFLGRAGCLSCGAPRHRTNLYCRKHYNERRRKELVWKVCETKGCTRRFKQSVPYQRYHDRACQIRNNNNRRRAA